MPEISKTNAKMVQTIKNKINKYVTLSSSIAKFDTLINKAKTSLKALKLLNKYANSLSKEINSFHKFNKVLLQNRTKIQRQKLYDSKLAGITSFADHKDTLKKVVDLLAKYKDFTFKQLPIEMNKKKLIQVIVKKQGMSREDIQALANKMSHEFKTDGVKGDISVALKYNQGWRSGYFQNFGSDPHMYSADIYDKDHEHYVDEQDHFDQVVFFAYESAGTFGGKSHVNDCFFKCLSAVLYSDNPFKDDFELKKYLKLSYNAMVDISHIPKIETKLKNIAINITGDHIYISPIKSNKIINIKLCDEHYTLDCKKSDAKVKHVSYKERKPLIYDKNTFMCYDGKAERFLSKDEMKEIYNWKTEYIIVNKNNSQLSLKEDYEQFIKDAEILKKESNGIINLYKTGNNKTTALDLFDRFTKHISCSDKIRQVEADFISKSSQGAIIFHEKYTGPAYKYDVKSMYPSIMKSIQLFPVKEGSLEYMTHKQFNTSTVFRYGVYRCIISGQTKMFKFNKKNYYTHIDLYQAKELNLTIELIVDDQPNFLYYSRDKLLTGYELFGNYVDTMFDLKEKKLTSRSKQIFNILWGALCEKYIVKKHIQHTDQDVIIELDSKIQSIRPFDDNSILIEISSNDNQYKHGFARMAPFLLSKGRSIISKIMTPFKDIAMRCHTDGVIFKERPINIKLGEKLGNLVYEGYSKSAEIVNSNKVIGTFILQTYKINSISCVCTEN